MLPPGRRRAGAIPPVMFSLALLFLFTATANAAGSVLGLDFGTLNLKAALIKPGIPLEIVPTKDSKRKEAAAVAFKPTRDSKNNIVAEMGSFPERAYGSDALALQGRFPGEVFPNLKPLLGLPSGTAAQGTVNAYRDRYPAIQAEQIKEMGTLMFKSSSFHEGEMPWNVEELLAMELANIRKNAENLAGKGASIEDTVITVPAFYTADEKRAIKRAAGLAGLDVNALVSDGLAVGVDYAKSRTFPEVTKGEKPEYHLVYDMGAGSSTATLLRFQSRSVKDVGKFNKTVQEVAVVGTGWDRTLGGDSLTNAVLNDYVVKFLEKGGAKAAGVKANGRAMSRLWKEAERARQVLSANNDVHSSFEELLPDVDFKTKMTRAEFESLCAEYAERVSEPINDALAAAKLSIDDVDSVILHGGAVRTPFVQKKLESAAGGSAKLRSNVNADESAVFGAAFKGAGLSPSFKVKEIRDSDSAGYAIGMSYVDGEKTRKQQLFASTSPVGSGAATKQVTFKDKDDFTFGFYQKIGEVEYPVTQIRTTNLTDGVKELNDKFGCERDDISTKFSVKLSSVDGLPDVVGGTVSCEVEGSGKKESIGDSVKDWFGFGKKDQEPLKEGEEDEGPTEAVEADEASSTQTESGENATSSSTATESSAPAKPTKRTESIAIKFDWSPMGNPQPGYEEIKRMRERLVAFERSDKARYAREEALNVLESYTYYVRDFLSNEDYAAVSTEKQRDEISKLLDSTRAFMEDSSKVAKAKEDEFREKLKSLKALVEPIQSRRQEEMNRPAMVDRLKESLNQTSQLVDMIEEQVKLAEERQSKASEYTPPPETSTTTPPSDDPDDLEEPDASTTTSPEGPTYTDPSDFNLYTNLDLTSVREAYTKAKTWLEEKEAEQAQLGPHEEPVLLVKEIEREAESLGQVMRDLLYQKMRAEEKPKGKGKGKSSSKTKSAKKGKKTKSATETESESAAAEPEETVKGPPIEDGDAETAEGREREHVIDEL